MTKQQSVAYSLVVACLFAVAVGQILTSLNVIQPLVVYSVLGAFENAFLASYVIGFGVCTLGFQALRFGSVQVSPVGLMFFVIALQATLVMGLSSLALLWLIPWWMLQCSDNTEDSDTVKIAVRNSSH